MIVLILAQRGKACACGKFTPLRLAKLLPFEADIPAPKVRLARSSGLAICFTCARTKSEKEAI